MVQPQVIQGNREEITAYLQRLGDRKNLILIVPAEESQREPTEEDIAAANARLRRHIVTSGSAGGLDNDSIDTDLAKEYADDHSVANPQSETA
jgi:hypothetical protein